MNVVTSLPLAFLPVANLHFASVHVVASASVMNDDGDADYLQASISGKEEVLKLFFQHCLGEENFFD